MAFLLLKDSMKQRLEVLSGLSCSSSSSASVVVASGRAIDRHSPRLQDPHRRLAPSSVPRPPVKTKQHNSSSSSSKDSSSSLKQQQQQYHNHGGNENSTAVARSSTSEKKKKKKMVPQVSPASSSRFLLNSSRLQPDDDITVLESVPPFIDDVFSGRGDAALPVPRPEAAPPAPMPIADSSAGPSSYWPSSETAGRIAAGADGVTRDDGKTAIVTRSCSTRTREQQVVVLRVSLHCKGCAGKVRKHISKMEGLTSLDIDIAAKKVTVVGDVTPLGVLNCISKVKSAQFWPDSAASSPPRASASF